MNGPAVKLFEIATFPATDNVPVAVFVPAPLKVILLKLLEPIVPLSAPLNSIVEPVAVKVPEFVQLPATV